MEGRIDYLIVRFSIGGKMIPLVWGGWVHSVVLVHNIGFRPFGSWCWLCFWVRGSGFWFMFLVQVLNFKFIFFTFEVDQFII